MMEIISFLNNNNTFIISILTLLLVITTIWYAFVTRKILKVNEETHIEMTRPYVLVSFEGVNNGLEFRIKNFGKTAAYKTLIVIDPPLDKIDMSLGEKSRQTIKYGHKPMLNQQFLPPDFEVKTILQLGKDFVTNNEFERVFNINIKYTDFKNNKFSSNYIVDISSILYGDKIQFYTDGYHLNGIKKILEDINNSIKKSKS